MNSCNPRLPAQHRRGYLLVELVVVVGLLAVFTVIIGSTFSAAYRGQAGAVRRNDRDHHVDAAMNLLRRDIWNASAMSSSGSGMTLTTADGGTIDWTWGPSWTRTVQQPAGTQQQATTRFAGLPTEQVAADIRRAEVTLHFGGAKTPAESISFVSQIMLGGAR